jgi:hypothetical protein
VCEGGGDQADQYGGSDQRAGRARPAPLSVARTMVALAQGFAAQYALFGDVPVQVVELGLKGLMGMENPGART